MSLKYTILDNDDFSAKYFTTSLDLQVDSSEILIDGIPVISGSAKILSRSQGRLEASFYAKTRVDPETVWGQSRGRTVFTVRQLPTLVGFIKHGYRVFAKIDIMHLAPGHNGSVLELSILRLELRRNLRFPDDAQPYRSYSCFLPSGLKLHGLSPKISKIVRYEVSYPSNSKPSRRRKREENSSQNRVEFGLKGLGYYLTTAADACQAMVYSRNKGRLPRWRDLYRFTSGLAFILGRNLPWTGFKRIDNRGELWILLPNRPVEDATLPNPLPDSLYHRDKTIKTSGSQLRALRCWLKSAKRSKQFNLFGCIHPILLAAGSPFEIKAQLLCSSLEGLCRAICKKADWPGQEETAEAVKELSAFIDTWACEPSAPRFPEPIRTRLKSILGMTSMPSAPSVIKMAAQMISTEVHKREIDAWQKLRNPTAHGQGLTGDHASLFISYDRVLTLFYRLCLRSIGYSGAVIAHHKFGEESCVEAI